MEPASQVDFVVQSVLAMPVAKLLRLSFEAAEVGSVVVSMPIQEDFCFRAGQLQATAIFAVADFAAVSAAGTTLPKGGSNATADATMKLLAPAVGERLVARGRAVHVGRSLTICSADVFALANTSEVLCATMLATARNFSPR